MQKDKIAILNDILLSLEEEKLTIMNRINWILNSDDSFKIDADELKELIESLSLKMYSIDQTRFFLEQLTAQHDLDSKDDLPDSTGG